MKLVEDTKEIDGFLSPKGYLNRKKIMEMKYRVLLKGFITYSKNLKLRCKTE